MLWYAVKEVHTISPNAPRGFVGVRLVCFKENKRTETFMLPDERDPVAFIPEEIMVDLIAALSRATSKTPINELPRIDVVVANGRGRITQFWPGPKKVP